MSRQRLTTKVAGEIDGDVYTMNTPEHEAIDPKVDEYAKGNPSAWGEDVSTNMSALPKKDEDSRDKDIRHASSKEAALAQVRNARILEAKAVKCIVAAQRMLPGASDETIEAQAADFMELPETSINATLARQEVLAQSVIAKAEKLVEDIAEEEKTAMTKEEKDAFAEKMKKARGKSATDDNDEDDKPEAPAEKEAKMKDIMINGSDKEEEDEKVKEAAKAEDEAEDEEVKVAGDDEDEEDDTTGKDASLLDQIFNSVEASGTKKGASSLSGMVKKEASEKTDDLSKLWGTFPDVSHIFG